MKKTLLLVNLRQVGRLAQLTIKDEKLFHKAKLNFCMFLLHIRGTLVSVISHANQKRNKYIYEHT